MITEFGQRLRSARKMTGMSLDALSKATGVMVSKQAISKYEKGLSKPGSEVLLVLAKALDVKVDYFFRPSKTNISDVAFRKKSKLSKREEDKIRFRIQDFLQKYIEIEEILNLPHTLNNPVAHRKIGSDADIERAAREIRQSWNLGEAPINQLTELLEDNGFKVIEVETTSDFAGLSGFADGLGVPVIAVSADGDCVRKRFTLAHELAHLVLDFSQCEAKRHEKLCHAFAGALLLPERAIRDELGGKRKKITEWELRKLKGIYGISIQAIMARALTLELITPQTFRMFHIHVSKAGWRKNEPGSYKGVEKANRFKQLVLQAVAEQIISYSKGAEFLDMTLGELEQEVHVVS